MTNIERLAIRLNKLGDPQLSLKLIDEMLKAKEDEHHDQH